MLPNDELVLAIYTGNFRKLEKDFVSEGDSPSSLILNMNCLKKDRPDGEYTIDFISLLLMGEANCPVQSQKFGTYVHLLDWVIKKDGLKKVLELVKHPSYIWDTQRIRLVKGGQIQPGDRKRIDISVSPEMAAHLKNLEERYLAERVYNGDFESVQECLVFEPNKRRFLSDRMFDIVHMMKAPGNNEFMTHCGVSFVSLILKGEADHPGNFFKYKKILDFVADNDGGDVALFAARKPQLVQMFPGFREQKKVEYIPIAVSDQMKAYLPHLKGRNRNNNVFFFPKEPAQK